MHLDSAGWEDLVGVALLGTAHRPWPDVLTSAAALAHARRLSRQPHHPLPAPEPAPGEILPVASPRLAAFFEAALLEGLADEWLRLMHEHRLLAPPQVLPSLLDLLADDPTRERDIRPLLGERGRWLMALRPAWAWLAGDDRQEHGTPAQRLDAWRRQRVWQPEAARSWLEARWRELPFESRLAYLHALGPTDEAFLQQALKDRRREVRKVAADLLARLALPPPPSPANQERQLLKKLVEADLAQARFPWSLALTEAVLRSLTRLQISWHDLALYMNPDALETAMSMYADVLNGHSSLRPPLEAMLTRLNLRAAMQRVFASG
ncbi:MAG TPA: DUF5691 domain-containing protein [Candidatus Xenobia bacterium]|jgi:hypothetical protein